MKEKREYPETERGRVFALLLFVAGFYGAYTLSVRGGVFCNAQTANMALFAAALGSGNWPKAAGYLVPLVTYFLGTVVSELMPKRIGRLRWGTLLMAAEITAVAVVGFIPASAPDRISQIIIVFICAMQSNTFRQSEGTAMASTFCTLHFRQFGVNLTRMLRGGEGREEAASKFRDHGRMLLSFMLGAFSASVLIRWLGTRAIWCSAAVLAVILYDLLKADLREQAQ